MAEIIVNPTVEELDDAGLFEIVNGVKVPMPPMSVESQILASRLAFHLSNYSEPLGFGAAYSLVLIPVAPERKRCRRPDVLYVPYSRWPKRKRFPATDDWDVLPTLCVEVVSPSDRAEDVYGKVVEYFHAGVQQVWVIHPRQQLVFVYTSLNNGRGLIRADTLDGGDVLPGFSLPLAELFPEPEANGEA